MKTLVFIVLFMVLPLLGGAHGAEKQVRPAYLDEPVEVRLIGETQPGEKYPLIVFLPFTTGSAETYFSIVRPAIGLSTYFAVIPAGTAQIPDYLPDFFSYLQWYEKRLLTDLPKILKDYPIDTAKVYINGYSLGGDLSWVFMFRQKELFAGAVIIGSRCSYVPSGKELKYLKEHKRRIVMLMGDRDLPERIRGMENSAGVAGKNGLAVWHRMFSGDHIIPGGDTLVTAFDLMLGNDAGAARPAPRQRAEQTIMKEEFGSSVKH